MKIKGWDLSFFSSGEWQVVDERLKDLEKVTRRCRTETYDPGDGYNPGRDSLFRALRLIQARDVRVAIIGQDPYPSRAHATGVAFSIPSSVQPSDWPPTIRSILKEYSTDLKINLPGSGNLECWSERGVLLWNAIPSCRSGQSLSHDWDEWAYLTRELIQLLSRRGIVFALLGQVARRYFNDISSSNNHIIVTSHPSPRGSMASRTPFTGSRLFSTINDKLNDQKLEVIDWKLP